MHHLAMREVLNGDNITISQPHVRDDKQLNYTRYGSELN